MSPIDTTQAPQTPSRTQDTRAQSDSVVTTVAQSALGKRSTQDFLSTAQLAQPTAQQTSYLQSHLKTWCDEQKKTPEYEHRLYAKQLIERCHLESSPSLDLSQVSLRLTSIPSFEGVCFPALRTFNCSNNRLKTLPDFSAAMPALSMFNCSENQLTVFPNFSSVMPALKYVHCQKNQLQILPDFSPAMPALCMFNCSENQLTVFPNFSSVMPALKDVDCQKNQLQILHDFSTAMPSLAYFNCSQNQLTELPTLTSVMPHLFYFTCENNLLTTLCDFSPFMPNLEKLYCSSNRLERLPNWTQPMPKLKSFKCSYNSLTALIDFSHLMPAIETFWFTSNQITALPHFSSPMPHLKELRCAQNQLTSIPEQILNWPNVCRINATGNRFSPAYGQILQTSLSRIRGLHPTLGPDINFTIYDSAASTVADTPLHETITWWLEHFKLAFPKAAHPDLWARVDARQFPTPPSDESATSEVAPEGASTVLDPFSSFYQPLLEHENQNSLNQFLHKLTETNDYRNFSSQNNVMFKVVNFLTSAATTKTFRDHMFTLIDEALSSCGDRVAFYLAQIEIQWKLDCEGAGLDPVKLAKLLIGVKRVELLDKHATQVVQERGLGDAIETFLYYQVNLKEALELPLSTEGMLYPAMSGVTSVMLAGAKDVVLAQTTSQEAVLALLVESSYWSQKLRQDHEVDFEAITTNSAAALEALSDELSAADYRTQIDQITAQRDTQNKELVLRLSQTWLESHFKELNRD